MIAWTNDFLVKRDNFHAMTVVTKQVFIKTLITFTPPQFAEFFAPWHEHDTRAATICLQKRIFQSTPIN